MFNKITLVVADSVEINRAIDVINICKYYFNFKNIKLFSDIENDSEYFVKIQKIKNIREYSKWILTELNDYIDTEFVLIIQHDGFILNPKSWTDEFLKYDYIGAPWHFRGAVVGNGGFSLRSKKLLSDVQNILTTSGPVKIDMPEDFIISGYLKEILIKKYNIKFAPVELAEQFAVEDLKKWSGEFGFHNLKYVDIFKDGWILPEIEYKTDFFRNKLLKK